MKDKIVTVVGTTVYSAANIPIGAVEEVSDTDFQVNGRRILLSGIMDFGPGSLYLSGEATLLYKHAAASTIDPGTNHPEQKAFQPSDVQAGVEVFSLDDKPLGRVGDGEISADHIKLIRALKRDIYIPFSAFMDVSDSKVVLNVRAHEIDKMDWHHPPLETGLGQ